MIVNISTNQQATIISNCYQHFNQSTNNSKFLQMIVSISTNQQTTIIPSNGCENFNQSTSYNEFLQMLVHNSTHQQAINISSNCFQHFNQPQAIINSFKWLGKFQPINKLESFQIAINISTNQQATIMFKIGGVI